METLLENFSTVLMLRLLLWFHAVLLGYRFKLFGDFIICIPNELRQQFFLLKWNIPAYHALLTQRSTGEATTQVDSVPPGG